MGYDAFNFIELLFAEHGPSVVVVLVFAAFILHMTRYAGLASNINNVLCDPSLSASQKSELIHKLTNAYKPIVINFNHHNAT